MSTNNSHQTISKEAMLTGFPDPVPAIEGDISPMELLRVFRHLIECAQSTTTAYHYLNFLFLVVPPSVWPVYSNGPRPTNPLRPGSHPSPLAPLCRASRGAPGAPSNTPRHLTRCRASFPNTPLTVISSSVVAKPPFGGAARAPPPHSKHCCPLTDRRVGVKYSGIREEWRLAAILVSKTSIPLFVVMMSLMCRVRTLPGRAPGAVWGCLGLSLGPLRGQPQHSQGQPQVAAKADIGDILFSTQLLNDPSKNCKKIKGWSETRKGEIPLSSTQKFGNASEKDSRLLIQERTTTFFLASSLKKMSCHTDVSTLVFR